jgi:predicted nucleotidyltransferase/HEPN domain-containing protein
MKTSLDHLPEGKRSQLSAIAALFRERLPQGLLVLFGSHARGDWVDDPQTGYQSDFDLLAVVREPKEADDVALVRDLERAFRETVAPTPVTLIAHDIKFINREIRMGQYFFGDIANEGILLYAGQKLDFATPKSLNPPARLDLGQRNFGYWFHSASMFFRGCRYYASLGELSHAAFSLHQAAERYYHTASLVITGYKERTHDLNALGQKAAEQHPLLVGALPKTEPEDERLYTLLRKAYIEARYSKSYRITLPELTALQGRVLGLARRVREACLDKLASFCGPDAVSPSLPRPPELDEPLAEGLPPPPDDPAELGRWARELASLADLRAREGEARGKAEGLREGKAEGLREGEARGLRAAVLDLCEAFGIEPTGEERARLDAMGVDELEGLRQKLKQTRRWPV